MFWILGEQGDFGGELYELIITTGCRESFRCFVIQNFIDFSGTKEHIRKQGNDLHVLILFATFRTGCWCEQFRTLLTLTWRSCTTLDLNNLDQWAFFLSCRWGAAGKDGSLLGQGLGCTSLVVPFSSEIEQLLRIHSCNVSASNMLLCRTCCN